MNKGIAISMILLLLVGTVVAGATIYFSYKSITGSPLSESECKAMMISWCIGCANVGFETGSGIGMDTELSTCANKYWGAGGHTDCDAESDCSSFLPGGGIGGGGTTTTTTTTSTTSTTTCNSETGGSCIDQSSCTVTSSCASNNYECISPQCCCLP